MDSIDRGARLGDESRTSEIDTPDSEPGKCARCCKRVYNKETSEFLGRTCKSWTKVLIYYILFILMAFGFFWAVMSIINVTYRQNTGRPNFKKIYLSTGATPGMAFMPAAVNKEMLSIIWYKFTGEDTPKNRRIGSYVKFIDNYITDETEQCKFQKNPLGKCAFDRENFGPCGVKDFGFENNTPCLYLKLNKIDDWFPVPYKNSKDIPKNTPPQVRKLIKYNKQEVYLYCRGEHAFDKDYIGDVDYYPEPIFNEGYFPFQYASSMNPTIAIHLKNIQRGVLVTLKCTMYAKNVISDADAKTLIYIHHS